MSDETRAATIPSGDNGGPLPDLPDECYPLGARPIPVRRHERPAAGLGRRWEVYRCWQGIGSTLVPQPTGFRYWRRKSAERMASRLTTAKMPSGTWFEVHPALGTVTVAGITPEEHRNGSDVPPEGAT